MVELPWDFSHGKVQLFHDKCRRSIIWPWCRGASNVAQDFNEKSQLATFVSATSATSSPSVSLPQDRQWTQLSRTAGDAQQSCTVQVQVLLPTDLTNLTKLTALCGSTRLQGSSGHRSKQKKCYCQHKSSVLGMAQSCSFSP